MAEKIFVSYSRTDRCLVEPLVKLLRVREPGHVFFDIDSISPGQLWRDELESALAAATYVILFWCYHAQTSREVEREFRAAVTLGKKVVPILLDDTALPSSVSRFQGIDFRSIPGFHTGTTNVSGDTMATGAVQSMQAGWVTGPRLTLIVGQRGGIPLGTPLISVFTADGGTVGRSTECDLQLPDLERSISRLQLKITHEQGSFVVRNIGVDVVERNEQRVAPATAIILSGGEHLSVGGYVLTAYVEQQAERYVLGPDPTPEIHPQTGSLSDGFYFCDHSEAPPRPSAATRPAPRLAPIEPTPWITADPFDEFRGGAVSNAYMRPEPLHNPSMSAIEACIQMLRNELFDPPRPDA